MDEEHSALISEQDCGETLNIDTHDPSELPTPVSIFKIHSTAIRFHPVNSLGSSGSRERSLDSDSEAEDAEKVSKRHILVSQESETSTEDDQISPRVSLDLSTVVPETIPEQPNKTDDFRGADAEETGGPVEISDVNPSIQFSL